jgi:hypothetical protein
MRSLDVQVVTRIWGLSNTQMTLAQGDLPDVLVIGGGPSH